MSNDEYVDLVFDSSEKVWREFGDPPILSYKTFMNVTFQNADLSNAEVVGAYLLNIDFIDCGVTGVDFSQAALFANVKFY